MHMKIRASDVPDEIMNGSRRTGWFSGFSFYQAMEGSEDNV